MNKTETRTKRSATIESEADVQQEKNRKEEIEFWFRMSNVIPQRTYKVWKVSHIFIKERKKKI